MTERNNPGDQSHYREAQPTDWIMYNYPYTWSMLSSLEGESQQLLQDSLLKMKGIISGIQQSLGNYPTRENREDKITRLNSYIIEQASTIHLKKIMGDEFYVMDPSQTKVFIRKSHRKVEKYKQKLSAPDSFVLHISSAGTTFVASCEFTGQKYLDRHKVQQVLDNQNGERIQQMLRRRNHGVLESSLKATGVPVQLPFIFHPTNHSSILLLLKNETDQFLKFYQQKETNPSLSTYFIELPFDRNTLGAVRSAIFSDIDSRIEKHSSLSTQSEVETTGMEVFPS